MFAILKAICCVMEMVGMRCADVDDINIIRFDKMPVIRIGAFDAVCFSKAPGVFFRSGSYTLKDTTLGLAKTYSKKSGDVTGT